MVGLPSRSIAGGDTHARFVRSCPKGSDVQLERWRPAVAGIVFSHRCRGRRGVFAEVLLINEPVGADDECHDPRIAVFHREGEKRESTSHLAIYDVVLRAALGLIALFS